MLISEAFGGALELLVLGYGEILLWEGLLWTKPPQVITSAIPLGRDGGGGSHKSSGGCRPPTWLCDEPAKYSTFPYL